MRPPSPHLLDTVYDCQSRQAMYSEYLAAEDGPAADLGGKAEVGDQVREVARRFAEIGGFDPELRRAPDSAGNALRAVADAMRELWRPRVFRLHRRRGCRAPVGPG